MEGVKSRLQSKTIQAAILAVLVTVASFVNLWVNAEVINIEDIKFWAEIGFQFVTDGVTLGLLLAVIRGRTKADKKIEPLPWSKEIKTLMKRSKS